jgi:hypothetical protein
MLGAEYFKVRISNHAISEYILTGMKSIPSPFQRPS